MLNMRRTFADTNGMGRGAKARDGGVTSSDCKNDFKMNFYARIRTPKPPQIGGGTCKGVHGH